MRNHYKKININQSFRINSYIIHRLIDGYYVILNGRNNTFHRLNLTGSFIFRNIKQQKILKDTIAEMLKEFSVSKRLARKDCFEFVLMLLRNGIIKVSCRKR